jgi:hypothetical protein
VRERERGYLCHVFDFDDASNGSLLRDGDLQVAEPGVKDPSIDATGPGIVSANHRTEETIHALWGILLQEGLGGIDRQRIVEEVERITRLGWRHGALVI